MAEVDRVSPPSPFPVMPSGSSFHKVDICGRRLPESSTDGDEPAVFAACKRRNGLEVASYSARCHNSKQRCHEPQDGAGCMVLAPSLRLHLGRPSRPLREKLPSSLRLLQHSWVQWSQLSLADFLRAPQHREGPRAEPSLDLGVPLSVGSSRSDSGAAGAMALAAQASSLSLSCRADQPASDAGCTQPVPPLARLWKGPSDADAASPDAAPPLVFSAGRSSAAVAEEGREAAKEQLLQFAAALSRGDAAQVALLFPRLQALADPLGDPLQRTLYHFMLALRARSNGSGADPSNQPMVLTPHAMMRLRTELDKHAPLVPFLDTFFGHLLSRVAPICSALHVVDLCCWFGLEPYAKLFAALAARGGTPPSVRITKVPLSAGASPDPQAKFLTACYKARLEAAAAAHGIPLRVALLDAPLQSLSKEALGVQPGEFLLVNASYRLMTLPDDSVTPSDPRQAALRALHSLQPHLLVLAEKEACDRHPSFLLRFAENLQYYGLLFHFMDQFPRHSRTRALVERELLGKAILNIVACEGPQRHLRGERHEHWAQRMQAAGFVRVVAPDEAVAGLRAEFGQGFRTEVRAGQVLCVAHGIAVAACSLWTANGKAQGSG